MTHLTFLHLFRYVVYCVFLVALASCTTQYPATSHHPAVNQSRTMSSASLPERTVPPTVARVPVVGERQAETTSVETSVINKPEIESGLQDIAPVMTAPADPQLVPVEQPINNRINIAESNDTLFKASEQGNTALMFKMIEQGANISSANANGETALHSAAAHNQITAVRLLIENGADVNSTTVSGWTPLHSAARFGAADVISLLIQSGAATQLRNNDGKSALDLAMQAGHQRAVEVLQGN